MRYLIRVIIHISLLVGVFVARLEAQNNDDRNAALIGQLKANSREMSFNGGRLSGAGADFLLREAGKSQFFLIGEEHGFAENPLLAAAILRELKGYKYFAAEIGRLTATRLETAARKKNARAMLADFNRQYPFSLPFFNWQEEGALLEVALKLPRGTVPNFWGIDQEFFFSPVYHFKRLREIVPNPKERAVVDEFYEKTRVELARAIENRNPGSAFMLTATAADFDRLEAVFGGKNAEAKQILRDLRESAEIYQKNARGEIYANNLQRSRLLKRNFMSHYNAALKTEKQPKVFFKFGSAHITRGRNYVNVFDLGNLVSELADSQGLQSFHVLVIAARGSYNKFFPFVGNEADKQKKFSPADVYSYADVRSLVSLADSSDWKVIDLRPLRPHLGTNKLPDLPRGIADIISGFDAVVLVNEAHPATFFEH